jgi:hypothetical protein
MPRSTRAAEPAVAPLSVHVAPGDVFSAESFRRAFGLRQSSLRREVRAGRLKVHKRCGRYFILGENVLAWLKGGEVRPRAQAEGESRHD